MSTINHLKTHFISAFYKQVIVDTIVQLSTRSILSYSLFHWRQNKIELNLSDSVLSLVYRQGLIWVRGDVYLLF